MCGNLRMSSQGRSVESLTWFSCAFLIQHPWSWVEAGIPVLLSGAASRESDLPDNWTDHRGAFAEFPRECFKAPNDFYSCNLPGFFPAKDCLLFIFSWQVGSVSVILVILLHLYLRNWKLCCLGDYAADFYYLFSHSLRYNHAYNVIIQYWCCMKLNY